MHVHARHDRRQQSANNRNDQHGPQERDRSSWHYRVGGRRPADLLCAAGRPDAYWVFNSGQSTLLCFEENAVAPPFEAERGQIRHEIRIDVKTPRQLVGRGRVNYALFSDDGPLTAAVFFGPYLGEFWSVQNV